MSLNEDTTVQLDPLSSQINESKPFSRLFNGWVSLRDLECYTRQLEQRHELLENLDGSHSLSTKKLLHNKVHDAQQNIENATANIDSMYDEEARSFSEIIQAMILLIAEQDANAIYAPLFSDLKDKSKTTLDTIQRLKNDLSQSVSQVRKVLIQPPHLKMESETRVETMKNQLCNVEFPRDAKHIYTIQQHRTKQAKEEWDTLINDAENTAMDNIIQQGILHALLKTPSHHIPTFISNAFQSIMRDCIQRVERAEHIYQLLQSLNSLWSKIQPLNDTLEEQMQHQETKERIEEGITTAQKTLLNLKQTIDIFVTSNNDRLAYCIGIHAQNMEEEMDLIEQHLNQFKTNVLHPDIGERLHTILKNFNLVLRNHAQFLRYILDRDAAAHDRALSLDDVMAACKPPISSPMEKVVEQLAEEAISTSLQPLIEKMDQLENLL